MNACIHAWMQFHGIWVSLKGLNSSAADHHPVNHPRLNASNWALGTVILGCSTVVYCELGRFLNFLFSLDLNVTVLIANLPLVTTNKQRV